MIKGSDGSIISEEFLIPEVRKQEIPKFKLPKRVKDKKVDNFDKNKSVFRLWKPDNARIIKDCFLTDIGYWRMAKSIKDSSDLDGVLNTLRNRYEELKSMFLSLAMGDNWPHVNTIDFGNFASDVKIIDEKDPRNNLRMADIDRMFITTKFGAH